MMKIAVYTHAECLMHDTGPGHPECAERLRCIMQALAADDIAGRLAVLDAPLASDEVLRLAHAQEYVAMVVQAAPVAGHARLDADTVLSPGSLNAARRAAGSGVAAVDAVMAKTYETAFCATRPPGHHAVSDAAMGFCVFNNVAIAALHALARHGLTRVAIVDFDVHHGNGTQDIVAREPRILYVSTHQHPLYPGTGHTRENRAGHLLNVPLAAGTDGAAYRDVFANAVLPALARFSPELLLVSAGFDAHRQDPLAELYLVEEDYRWLGEQMRAVAEQFCQGRSVSFLEGGYALPVLGDCVAAYLGAFFD